MNGSAMYAEVAQLGKENPLLRHAGLVKRIAYHLLNRLPPSVQVDDLIQAGMLGLLEASRNYDPTQGASFETFAGIRIRGAMLDEIRRLDWTPRSVHRKARQLSEAMQAVENATGRDATPHEVAEKMGISLDDYHAIVADASRTKLFSYDQPEVSGEFNDVQPQQSNPFEELNQEGFQQDLATAIRSLPEREQLVMSLYYDNELNLKEIGQVLEVSESRVCQIHGQALLRIRAKMQAWVSE